MYTETEKAADAFAAASREHTGASFNLGVLVAGQGRFAGAPVNPWNSHAHP